MSGAGAVFAYSRGTVMAWLREMPSERDWTAANDERSGPQDVWRCNCGSVLFELRRDAAYCIGCDTRAGWCD